MSFKTPLITVENLSLNRKRHCRWSKTRFGNDCWGCKQAIYRWRGGEVDQFINLQQVAADPNSKAPKVTPSQKQLSLQGQVVKFNVNSSLPSLIK